MLRPLTEKRVRDALSTVLHPLTGGDIVASGAVEHIGIKDGNVTLILKTDPQAREVMEKAAKGCETAVSALSGVKSVRTVLTAHRPTGEADNRPPPAMGMKPPAPPPPERLEGVRTIIAVASGKGGVGKSTTAVNLACALKQRGLNVGVLDADIYGPSIPKMLGAGEKPGFTKNDRIEPAVRHGIRAISMGHLVPEDRATIWRGPMVIGAVQQLLKGVAWDIDGDLDVLVVDLPPGTGDAQLTLVQTVPIDGVVLVSTPQDIALIDARKAYDMFDQVGIPVLGMIENMSQFVCPDCGSKHDIFGHGGAVATAKEKGIEVLGEIPLAPVIMRRAETGTPIVLADPGSEIAARYGEIAGRIAEQIDA
ncbi:Scaffold protein for [4Fe-4S] cluster assembly ApbC, MRP-like [Altererythrobacter epoxidivorans]|uniref:Iron-sulfur cluster carrier protein n=1 Tax=Altererythrobacter epoxidivorans TaxID=361183 RepID=A0A0M3TA39_9SPHN|nr:Mrp/NBP35 family ATP-binding protein [Altererythrobacter epoxidivorans]ALE16096.1 Scaffold protein for [4Fe-4S] cluster assembly ApbC, MRP-like [Altererythrobacter epoxidivorans]